MTLFGSVPSEQAKQAASEEVRKVGGVQSVNNQLEVVAEADSARVAEKDSDVKSAIESRLDARGELAPPAVGSR